MKLRLHQRQELEETEIDIAYSRMTNRLSKMVGYIRQYTYMVEAFWNGKSFLIPLDEILYFDTTDRKTSVYKGYKRDKIEMRGDRAEMSDFPLYLNTVAGGLDRRDQTIGGFSFVVKIYAVPVIEIIG